MQSSIAPPPLPAVEKVAPSAVWSLVLAGLAWAGLVMLIALGVVDKPAADNRTAFLVTGAACLGMASTLTSVVLAVRVLFLRRRGLVFAFLALALCAPPMLLILVGIVRAVFK